MHRQLKFQAVKPNVGGTADQSKMYLESECAVPPFDIRELIFDGETSINATDARRMIIQDLVQQVAQVLKKGMIGDEQVNLQILPFL